MAQARQAPGFARMRTVLVDTCVFSWIAATALAFDIPLVTHNRSDFAHIPELKIVPEPIV